MVKEMVCFDVESGGLCPFSSALCSVTLKVVGKDIIKTIFVKPQSNLSYSYQAMKINGLTQQYLTEHGISEVDTINEIKRFLNDNFSSRPNLLAHNISFDIQFLNALFKRNNEEKLFTAYAHYHPQDTMIQMALLRDTGIINQRAINLRASYKYFHGIDFDNAHTSEADVIATEKLYYKIQDLLIKLNNSANSVDNNHLIN